MAKIEAVLEELAAPVCAQEGVYIYECEYKKEGGSYYLRLFIDKDGGVTIDDCERVSRLLNEKLDELDPIKEEYIFEVSSPGIDRKLTRDWHFEKAIGKEVDIKLFAPFEGSKTLSGVLVGYDHALLSIDLGEKTVRIEKGKTSSVRLAFKF